ncbi:MAG: SIMPL domain-containing protein [Candidatus Limnocylindrales bacterium]
MSTTSRFLGLGVALGLAGGLLVGGAITQPGRAAATTPSAAARIASSEGAAMAPTSTTVTSGGTTTAQSGTAMVYPYGAGSPGLAPEHTIVVTGVGEVSVQSDGSDRASAQQGALAAALADAKAQADAIAADTGLSISGVLSVSASVSPDYGVEPMVANASSEPACIIAIPGSRPSASAGPVVPQSGCLPEPIYRQTLSASVMVEYRVG